MDLRERAPGARPTPTVRHPWEAARAAFLIERLRGVIAMGSRVLDVGAGDAWLATELQQATGCDITCWDAHFSDEDKAELRARGMQTTRVAPRGPFDVALLLDVLEHAEDDRALLRRVVERVRPGGAVLVTVPAWPALFSAHDRALHHHRRYTPRDCRTLLQGEGLIIESSGGLFHSLLLPRALAALLERVGLRKAPESHGIGHWRHGRLAAEGITAALRAEQRLSALAARRQLDVPGLSYFALCSLRAGT